MLVVSGELIGVEYEVARREDPTMDIGTGGWPGRVVRRLHHWIVYIRSCRTNHLSIWRLRFRNLHERDGRKVHAGMDRAVRSHIRHRCSRGSHVGGAHSQGARCVVGTRGWCVGGAALRSPNEHVLCRSGGHPVRRGHRRCDREKRSSEESFGPWRRRLTGLFLPASTPGPWPAAQRARRAPIRRSLHRWPVRQGFRPGSARPRAGIARAAPA